MRRTLKPLLLILGFATGVFAQNSIPESVLNSRIPTLRGESLRLTTTSPPAKILFICASWARLCDFAAKDMSRFQRTYGKRGVEIIGLTNENPSTDARNVRKFVRRNGIKFQMAWMNDEMEAALSDSKHRRLVPIVIILDKQHRIDTKFFGYSIRETPNKIIAVLDRLIRT
jgi:peroxiredoxin